ncbi:MAG: DUF503 domain-containing protein [Syntrophales bacterium]|nr:DUF503 domain-containing protein [Syntrophales bacterium]
MIVGSGWVEILIPDAHSLKEKRGILARLIKRTQNEFNISIAEVGLNEIWKRACVGFAVVGNDRVVIERKMAMVVRFIEELNLGEVVHFHQEVMHISQKEKTGSSTYMEDKYGDH